MNKQSETRITRLIRDYIIDRSQKVERSMWLYPAVQTADRSRIFGNKLHGQWRRPVHPINCPAANKQCQQLATPECSRYTVAVYKDTLALQSPSTGDRSLQSPSRSDVIHYPSCAAVATNYIPVTPASRALPTWPTPNICSCSPRHHRPYLHHCCRLWGITSPRQPTVSLQLHCCCLPSSPVHHWQSSYWQATVLRLGLQCFVLDYSISPRITVFCPGLQCLVWVTVFYYERIQIRGSFGLLICLQWSALNYSVLSAVIVNLV